MATSKPVTISETGFTTPTREMTLEQLRAEVTYFRGECSMCAGAKFLVNDGDAMRPAHGWTGPLANEEWPGGGVVVQLGEVTACPDPSHRRALSDPASADTSATGR